ncbi:hypothetical protein JTB14_010217 [Gonioctena quinquepunctata]|nr:hypothetical protein JTB14_010217 [Gonioctena quinquepunctata]
MTNYYYQKPFLTQKDLEQTGKIHSLDFEIFAEVLVETWNKNRALTERNGGSMFLYYIEEFNRRTSLTICVCFRMESLYQNPVDYTNAPAYWMEILSGLEED